MAPPDLRFRPSVDVTGIASLLAAKPVQEERLRIAEDENRRRRFGTLLEAIQLGSNLASQGLQRSEIRQERAGREGLAEIINRMGIEEARLQQPVRGPIRVEGPATEAGQVPTVIGRTTLGETPQGREAVARNLQELKRQLLPAAAKVLPEAFARSLFTTEKEGAPPRSVEGIFVDQFNRGLIDEATLKAKIEEFNPSARIVKDNEGNQYVFNQRTGQTAPLIQPRKPGKGGKSKAIQFTPAERRAITEAKNDLEKDPVVKEIKKSLNKALKTRNLIVQNQPGSIGFIRTQLAKAAGEQRITDQDIDRFSGSPAIAARLKRKYREWIAGNLTEGDREDYLIMLDIAEKKDAEELNGLLNARLDGLRFDLTNENRDAVRRKIGAGVLSAIERINKRGNDNTGISGLSDEELDRRIKELQEGKRAVNP